MDIVERFNLLAEEIERNMANPDIDIELHFPEDYELETRRYPYIKVRYITDEHNIHEKEIDIDPEYWEKDIKDLASFVAFQIQQFMEEIDSVEYGGE